MNQNDDSIICNRLHRYLTSSSFCLTIITIISSTFIEFFPQRKYLGAFSNPSKLHSSGNNILKIVVAYKTQKQCLCVRKKAQRKQQSQKNRIIKLTSTCYRRGTEIFFVAISYSNSCQKYLYKRYKQQTFLCFFFCDILKQRLKHYFL